MSTAALRARYVSDSVTTASPARLLVMLYDRLALDLRQAEDGLRGGDRVGAGGHLAHAQQIVLELLSSLDVDAWEGGPALASLYTYLASELTQANVAGDADRVAACAALVQPLREAWHVAASETAQAAPVVAGGVA
ncbi:MAG TPA: flagellar export chaperone FliS [Mycobacteriales bacterium]|jgi:flagellar protein FliS